jgi:predicted DNA-binding protein (MmcQ/YjbR family)
LLKPKGGLAMTKQQFLEYCLNTYGTSPDYPFDEDFETAVLRHADNRKWYALVMKVSRRKFGFDSDEVIDVVNLKLPTEMFGSFGAADGVYPAYHMNKLHWISVLLPDAPDDVVQFLTNVSFEATRAKPKRAKR